MQSKDESEDEADATQWASSPTGFVRQTANGPGTRGLDARHSTVDGMTSSRQYLSPHRMSGSDPASDARSAIPGSRRGDLLPWRECAAARGPPRSCRPVELAALDGNWRGRGSDSQWAVRLRCVGEVLLAALAADFTTDPTAQMNGAPPGSVRSTAGC